MLDIMYEIPKDDNIGEVVITRGYIEGNGETEDSASRTGSTASRKWKVILQHRFHMDQEREEMYYGKGFFG